MEYTKDELAAIGAKVVERRKKAQVRQREERRIKNALYAMYTTGKFGDLKI